MVNQQMWDRVTQFVSTQAAESGATDETAAQSTVIWAQKMTKDDDPESFINTFEQTTIVTGWAVTSCKAGPYWNGPASCGHLAPARPRRLQENVNCSTPDPQIKPQTLPLALVPN